MSLPAPAATRPSNATAYNIGHKNTILQEYLQNCPPTSRENLHEIINGPINLPSPKIFKKFIFVVYAIKCAKEINSRFSQIKAMMQ